MGSLKSLTLLVLLLSLSLAVIADTSKDDTNGKNEVKPSEATGNVEPQQRGGCRYGCCGAFAFGQCAACCSRPHATEVEAKADTVEPQQGGRGGCRYGCCGSYAFGRCSACCSRPQTTEVEAKVDTVEPQQGGRGGCRYGCCGSYAFGRCSACCSRPQATEVETKAEQNDVKGEGSDAVVEPQQIWGGGCRFGCCGGWFYGRCSYCCRQPQAAETVETVEPQQRIGGGCRYGCCGVWRYGRCSYCCRSPQAEAEGVDQPQQRGSKKKSEEAKP